MRVLPAAGHRRMPWKNGGGETVEIARHPEGAGLSAFDWRVSMATVAADGPFSEFPGVERTLSILSGAGLDLSVGGIGERRLGPADPPFPFPADAPAFARLVDGPVTDLNVMTRRGACAHRVRRLHVAGVETLATASVTTVLVCRAGPCLIDAIGAGLTLEALDAVWLDAPARLTLEAADADLFVIEIAMTA
ncbi:HutD/Ves family protein [Ensifer soli]|uniref:HutD/Ves family protein n=1 Tax=Ciceribacter sp. sgz301302 TaxID=3342379 RepID=UPI0035BA1963